MPIKPTHENVTARRSPRIGDERLPTVHTLGDEDDLEAVEVMGDFVGAECSGFVLRECRLSRASLTGSHLRRATFIDCVVTDSELSGTILEECRFERVEFRNCRQSGLQAQESRFTDVAILACKADGANFRMTVWERGELGDSNLSGSDFYGAKMPGTRVHGCDLSGAELSKCDLTGSRIHRCGLEGIRGGDGLRGVTIGSDQMIPAAIALFDAMGITVDDEGET